MNALRFIQRAAASRPVPQAPSPAFPLGLLAALLLALVYALAFHQPPADAIDMIGP